MNALQESRIHGIHRLRIAIAPEVLANDVNLSLGEPREIPLIGARTPSGTFEISEAMPARTRQAAGTTVARPARNHAVVAIWWRRLLIAASVAAILSLALFGRFWLAKPPTSPVAGRIAESGQIEVVSGETSIAVLPFQNLSDEKQFAFLVTGLQNEILSDLSKISGLKVISRTSMKQYQSGAGPNLRDIARQVGARFLVEGTVQRADGHIRVSAQLIDGRTDMHLWGERYDRKLLDAFAIENDVAEQIVAQVKGKLSPRDRTAIEAPPRR